LPRLAQAERAPVEPVQRGQPVDEGVADAARQGRALEVEPGGNRLRRISPRTRSIT